MIADRLEKLVEDMVDKGVRFDDAIREFEKRFITRVLDGTSGTLRRYCGGAEAWRTTLP